MNRKDKIRFGQEEVRRALSMAGHLSSVRHVKGPFPAPPMEATWNALVTIVEKLSLHDQDELWGYVKCLIDCMNEMRSHGINTGTNKPPPHVWSVRAAMREGAKTVAEISAKTGLPDYEFQAAWEYVKRNPLDVVTDVGTLEV